MLSRLNSAAGPIALIALFVALGGGAYAVKKSSVGSKEIKNGAVKSKDVKNGGLKGKDISANKLEGEQIDEATLEGVDAESLQGKEIVTIDETGDTGPGQSRTALELGGLRIEYYCSSGNLYLGAYSEVENAMLGSSVINQNPPGGANVDSSRALNPGSEFELQIGAVGANVNDAMTHVNYWNPEGSVVTAQIWSLENTNGTCRIFGHAIG